MAINSLHYLYHSEIYYIDHFLIINLTLDRVTVVCVLCMLLLLLCGDIETNPGPTRYPCKLCRKPVAKTHRALCCEGCDQWVHILCAGIPKTEYERLCDDSNEDQWFCSICVQQLDLPSLYSQHHLLRQPPWSLTTGCLMQSSGQTTHHE